MINSNSFAGSLETKVSFDGTLESNDTKFQSSKLNEIIRSKLKLMNNYDNTLRPISPLTMGSVSPMTFRETIKPTHSFAE